MPVRKVLKKGKLVFLPMMFYENRKNIVFKVFRSIVYYILDNYVCVDYLCCPEAKPRVTNKGQGFENRTYNDV